MSKVIPGNHASTFAPVMEPTFRAGASAMTTALMGHLARPAQTPGDATLSTSE